MIKVEEDTFGFISVINLHKYSTLQCIQQIKKFTLDNCDEEQKEKLNRLYEDTEHPFGLIICERVLNLPLQLSYYINLALFDEIKWAHEDEPTPEECESFMFKNYIVITKVFQDTEETNKNKKSTIGNPKTLAIPKPKKQKTSNIFYHYKVEDEFYKSECDFHYTFPLVETTRCDSSVKDFGMVIIVESSKSDSILKQLKTFIE